MKKTLLALGLASAFSAAIAGPADYVYTPVVEYGEKELDLKYGVARNGADDREHAGSLGVGLGVTPFWFTEVYGKWERPAAEGTRLEAFEWENKFQLTETGKYAVDVGLVTELEIPRESEDAKEIKIGALFQKDFGPIQANFNVLLERKFGGDKAPDEERETELGYQWQAKYRAMPSFEFGAQGFGEVGEWNDWEARKEQKHLMGPAVFGKIDLGSHQKLKYNAAWLLGASDAAPNHTFRMQLEYEF